MESMARGQDKAHSDMCEYMEAVESGEIEYL